MPAKEAKPRGHAPQQLENVHPAPTVAHSPARVTQIFSSYLSRPDTKMKSSPVCGNEIIGIIALGEKLQVLSSLSKVC